MIDRVRNEHERVHLTDACRRARAIRSSEVGVCISVTLAPHTLSSQCTASASPEFSAGRRGDGGPVHKGQRSLYAVKDIQQGEVVHVEAPLVAAQHLWNKTFKYACCSHCLAPLESATQTACRLSRCARPGTDA